MTTCETYRQQLDRLVEERCELTPELSNHFQSCESTECQNHFAEYQLLNVAIQDWQAALPEVDFVDAVVNGIEPVLASRPVSSANRSQVTASNSNALVSLTTVLAVLSLCIILVIGNVTQKTPQVAQLTTDVGPAVVVGETGTTIEQSEVQAEAELRELGKTYGSWVQGAANKLTDTMIVGFIEKPAQSDTSGDWFTNLSEQMEPIESKLDATFKLILEENSSEMDDQTFVPARIQNEYLGLLLSKSASLNPLFTLMLV